MNVAPVSVRPAIRATVSINQAAALAAVCRRTIYHWMHAGKVEHIRTAGGAVRIFTDSLFRGAQGERISL